MPVFIPKTVAPRNGIRFINWPGDGVKISDQLGITHAAIIPPGASTIHVGGQVGLRADGTVPGVLEDEIIEAFDHIDQCLRESGLTGSRHDVWGCVFRINTWHANTDKTFAPTLLKVMRSYLGENRPIFTGVDVAKLLRQDLHLEIEVQAFLPRSEAREEGGTGRTGSHDRDT